MRAIQQLEQLYFNGDKNSVKICLTAFLQADRYALANKKTEDALIDDILRNDIPINATLYDVYSKNLRKAVDKVFYEDKGNGLSDCLRANVSRFAAYKAYHATQQVRGEVKKDGDMDRARKVLHTFNRYQAAEYNTTVSRCRTAKQFEEFSAPDNMRLFPNLRWLPSRSATPRELHMEFYNRVWAKDDPFWSQNQPGNLWNCKCDWEETSDPVTDGNPTAPVRHDGLEGNPAITGEVFSDNCAYVKHSGKNRKERDKVEDLCTSIAHNIIRKTAKTNPLLSQSFKCEIEGVKQDVNFAEWGISETAHSMLGRKKTYWLKNEILENPQRYFEKAEYINSADVDLTHNTRKKTLKLKKHFKKYFYAKTQLADGTDAYLNIVLHDDGKFYLYTISKNITIY